MEILEQTPPIPISDTEIKISKTNQRAHQRVYKKTWNKFLWGHALTGLIGGQLLCLATEAWWPLTPILGLILGIGLAYKKVWKTPGDLTDWQIALLANKSVIRPFNVCQVEPDSYDVLLGNHFTRIEKGGTQQSWTAEEITISPGECLLAHTQETFKLPDDLKGTLQGKSSWARLSLFVECAGLFDKGFEGTAVLELYNASPNHIVLKAGDRIAQMSFHRTLPAAIPYGSKFRTSHYQQQQGAKSSWLTKLNRIIK